MILGIKSQLSFYGSVLAVCLLYLAGSSGLAPFSYGKLSRVGLPYARPHSHQRITTFPYKPFPKICEHYLLPVRTHWLQLHTVHCNTLTSCGVDVGTSPTVVPKLPNRLNNRINSGSRVTKTSTIVPTGNSTLTGISTSNLGERTIDSSAAKRLKVLPKVTKGILRWGVW